MYIKQLEQSKGMERKQTFRKVYTKYLSVTLMEKKLLKKLTKKGALGPIAWTIIGVAIAAIAFAILWGPLSSIFKGQATLVVDAKLVGNELYITMKNFGTSPLVVSDIKFVDSAGNKYSSIGSSSNCTLYTESGTMISEKFTIRSGNVTVVYAKKSSNSPVDRFVRVIVMTDKGPFTAVVTR